MQDILTKQAVRYDLPKLYKNDLQIDIDYLASIEETDFIWVLRENGTHIFDLRRMNHLDILLCINDIEVNYGNQERHYYYYHRFHMELREVTFNGLIRFVCNYAKER